MSSHKTVRRLALGLIVTAAAVGACAEGEVDFDEEDDPQTSTTVSAGPGGSGAGGMAGAGGTNIGPCELDCSTIDTPPCQVAECNVQTKQCEVVPAADGTGCDDGVFCTIDDSCVAGTCTGGPPNDCGMAPGECQEVVCDEMAQSCSTTPSGNGTACTHTDLCMVNTTCLNGTCQGTAKDCFFSPVPNECHVSVCNPMNGMCEPQIGNEGLGCTDPNDLCTVGKTCSQGSCVGGGPKDCTSLTMGCFNGVCDPMSGQCVPQPVPPGGSCVEAQDDCNVGVCDMNGMCQPVPTNEGGTCEDGNPCTAGETCSTGACTGGTMINQIIHFQETFANNNAGWSLDTEWQIGPATTSTGHTSSCGNGDPGTDHTPATTDNGVAGVVIGGNAATNLHPFYYLTSPPINVANVSGPLWLGYWRWLNSDYTPFMQNTVEVWDGTTWVMLWQTGSFPGVTDSAWTQQSFDIAAYKNSALKVRFGFTIGSSGVYTCSQWNVDDVVIANVVCP